MAFPKLIAPPRGAGGTELAKTLSGSHPRNFAFLSRSSFRASARLLRGPGSETGSPKAAAQKRQVSSFIC